MPCTNCTSGPNSLLSLPSLYTTNSLCPDCTGSIVTSSCVVYGGPNLACSTILNQDTLDVALQKIDTRLCTVTGSYATYNMGCINDGTVSTEADFVAAITGYVCNLNTTYGLFSGTTFPAYQDTVDSRFMALEKPGITDTVTGMGPGNTLAEDLGLLGTAIGTLRGELDITAIPWSSCFSVPTPPVTVADAIALLNTELCLVKGSGSGGTTLPVFNNTGSCLSAPGSAESLVDTVTKIRTRVCQSPILTNNTLSAGSVVIPTAITDLNGTLQAVLTQLDALSKLAPVFHAGDFTTAPVDPSNTYKGVTVSLATASVQDRFVAATASDTTPGTLVDKLSEGTNITLDSTTTPGKVIINSTGGSGNSLVKANINDTNPGVLDNKIAFTSPINGFSLSAAYNPTLGQVVFSPSLDMAAFAAAFMGMLENDPTLKAQFCALVASCPSPCAAPTNVQATAV